ncbi:MAG: hypothetical protein ACM3NQ_13715 [Bacteroidales bacterium]
MRVTARLVPLLMALVGVCCGGGGSSTAPSPTTLAGTWKASRAEFVSASNSGVKVEAVSQGYSILLTLESAGTYRQVVTAPGESGETTTGSWSASSDVLTLKPAGVSFNIQFDLALNGNTLSLSGGHVQFDINGDNVDEETILNLAMTRQ